MVIQKVGMIVHIVEPISYSFQFSSSGQDRIECDVREYPPNSSFVEDVGNRLSSFISGTIFHDIRLSGTFEIIFKIGLSYSHFPVTGFCNSDQTFTVQYGTYTWPETVVGDAARVQCSETTFATRVCTGRVSWGDPDYSQCNSGRGCK